MTYEPESEFLKTLWRDVPSILICNGQRTYVDLGCSHPDNASITSFVRHIGWRGVAVDANAAYRAEWEASGYGDHFVCALLSDQPTARFCTHENSFTSRISDTPATDYPERWGILHTAVEPTRAINDILHERGIEKIDLLCCDLEGHEFRVLRTLDFERHSPAFIIVEFVCAGEPNDPRAVNFLLSKGYELIQLFPSNAILRRK